VNNTEFINLVTLGFYVEAQPRQPAVAYSRILVSQNQFLFSRMELIKPIL